MTKPSAIYIGDSFTWTLINNFVFDFVNSKWEFWFYMKERYVGGAPLVPRPMDTYDWQSAIDKTDCVVLFYTAPNLPKLGNGFIEAAYGHYFPNKK